MSKKEGFFYITVCSALSTAVILLSVLACKYFFKDEFGKFEKFYINEFLSETRVDEVLKEDKNYEI